MISLSADVINIIGGMGNISLIHALRLTCRRFKGLFPNPMEFEANRRFPTVDKINQISNLKTIVVMLKCQQIPRSSFYQYKKDDCDLEDINFNESPIKNKRTQNQRVESVRKRVIALDLFATYCAFTELTLAGLYDVLRQDEYGKIPNLEILLLFFNTLNYKNDCTGSLKPNLLLKRACTLNWLHGIKLSLNADAKINDASSELPLQLIITHNHFDLFNLLLEKGANVNGINLHGNTPLHTAACHPTHALDWTSRLIKAGAVDSYHHGHETALTYAIRNKNRALIALYKLLQPAAFENCTDEKYNNFFHLSAFYYYEGIYNDLKISNAKVNVANKEGETPLHVAARYGNEASFLFFIQLGACPDRPNRYGMTPRSMAPANWIY
jgi:ankyrin repeat protein